MSDVTVVDKRGKAKSSNDLNVHINAGLTKNRNRRASTRFQWQ